MNLSWAFDLPKDYADLIAVFGAGIILLIAFVYVSKIIYTWIKKRDKL